MANNLGQNSQLNGENCSALYHMLMLSEDFCLEDWEEHEAAAYQ
jgi:hypothetical protein